MFAALRSVIIFPLLFLPAFAFSQGNALDFDGTNDYVDLGNLNYISGGASGEYTLEVWIKLDAYNASHTYFFGDEQLANNGVLWEISPSGYVTTFHMTPNARVSSTNIQVPLNKWTHLALVQNGSTVVSYVNGAFDATLLSGPQHQETATSTLLGKFPASNDRFLNGQLDEVRVWNVARSQTDIQNSMHKMLSGRESGLAYYYTFDQGSGTSLIDQSTNGQNGTLTNGPSWVASNAGILPSKGNALDFDGTQDERVDLGNGSAWNIGTTFSFEAWVRPESRNPVGSMVFNKWTSGTEDKHLFILNNGLPQFALFGTGIVITGATTVPLNSWTHIAATYDGTTAKLYINGVQDGSQAATADVADDTGIMYLANNPDRATEYGLDGQLDEVRFWSSARTEAEIQDNMNGTLSGTESGLVAYYDFNGTTGTKLRDLSLNGNHGTLENMENADWVSSEIGWSNTAYIDNTVHFRTMSSPVTTSYADILAEVWLQGTGTTGGDYAGGTPNVWTWNNAASGDGAGNWTAVTDYTANVSAGQGFLYYHFNKDSGPNGAANTADTKISVSGTENSNPSITVNTNTNGWTLVGNPFSQPIHWDAFATKTNVYADAQFYNGSTGAWVTTASTPAIAPFRAFFVRSTNSSGALNIGTAAQRAAAGFRGKSAANMY
jgi:hypothetical protein